MSHPRFDQHFRRVKSALGTSPEEGWVFGVCSVLARKMNWELWSVRLVAAIALLIFTLATVLVYFAAAMLMDETRPGAQRKMKCWANKADRLIEKLWSAISDQTHRPRQET